MDDAESNTTAAGPSPNGKSLPEGATSFRTIIGAAAWLSVVLATMIFIINHSNSPGSTGNIPARWPEKTQIPLDDKLPTLVMFAHPHCPCTRASIGELEMLMARCQGKVSAHVMFIQPSGTAEDWTKTKLWSQASAIPGVTVHRDHDGSECRRFNSETSGQTVLYGPDGSLQFQGGITISRGHSGDSPGRSALMELMDHTSGSQVKTPVFGCSLFETACQEGSELCKP